MWEALAASLVCCDWTCCERRRRRANQTMSAGPGCLCWRTVLYPSTHSHPALASPLGPARPASMVRRDLLVALAVRLTIALTIRTAFAPDEFWQSIEVAHRMVFGCAAAARRAPPPLSVCCCPCAAASYAPHCPVSSNVMQLRPPDLGMGGRPAQLRAPAAVCSPLRGTAGAAVGWRLGGCACPAAAAGPGGRGHGCVRGEAGRAAARSANSCVSDS